MTDLHIATALHDSACREMRSSATHYQNTHDIRSINSTLIPGLLDDIVLYEVVCRLPWHTRPLLTILSTSWRSAMQQSAAYSARTRALQRLRGLLLVHPEAENPVSCRKIPQSSSSIIASAGWTISMLDSESNIWRRLPPICGRSSLLYEQSSTACVDGKVFIIGGYDPLAAKVCGDVFMLDLGSGFCQWKQLPSLRCPRYAALCTALPGKHTAPLERQYLLPAKCTELPARVYVVGGYSSRADSPSSYVAVPEVYDVAAGEWEALPELPCEEEFSCQGVLPLIEDGTVFAYGRCFENDNWDENPAKVARIYNAANREWTSTEFDYSSCCAILGGYFHDLRAGVLYRYKNCAESRIALKGRLPTMALSNVAVAQTNGHGCLTIARELISAGDEKPHELYAIVRGGDGTGSECDRLLRGVLNDCEEVSWHTVTSHGFPGCYDGSQVLYLT